MIKKTLALRTQLLDDFVHEEEKESEAQAQSQDEQSRPEQEQAEQSSAHNGWLSDQDRRRNGWDAHWTVMNKVDDEQKVQDALAEVTQRLGEAPEYGKVEGLLLWRYLVGGRWEPVKEYRFARS